MTRAAAAEALLASPPPYNWRARRTVLVIDGGRRQNRFVTHSQGRYGSQITGVGDQADIAIRTDQHESAGGVAVQSPGA